MSDKRIGIPSIASPFKVAILPKALLTLCMIGTLGWPSHAYSQPPQRGDSKLSVELLPEGDDFSDTDIGIRLLGTIVYFLRLSEEFNEVYSKKFTLESDADFLITVDAENVRDRDVARFFIGALGGRSGIDTVVSITDTRTGELINKSNMAAQADQAITTFQRSSTEQALERMAELVTNFVIESVYSEANI